MNYTAKKAHTMARKMSVAVLLVLMFISGQYCTATSTLTANEKAYNAHVEIPLYKTPNVDVSADLNVGGSMRRPLDRPIQGGGLNFNVKF